jgi:hypothetical protein
MAAHEGNAIPTYLARCHCGKLSVQVGGCCKENRRYVLFVQLVFLHEVFEQLPRGIKYRFPRICLGARGASQSPARHSLTAQSLLR